MLCTVNPSVDKCPVCCNKNLCLFYSSFFIGVLNAETSEDFEEEKRKLEGYIWEQNVMDHLWQCYFSRSDQWALYKRRGLPTRGQNTNNVVENSFRRLKDRVLCRRKAYNAVHLSSFLIHDLSISFTGSILSKLRNPFFIPDRKKTKLMVNRAAQIPHSNINELSKNLYSVMSSQGDKIYVVDISSGHCSCPQGVSGALCKHQLAITLKVGDFAEATSIVLGHEQKCVYFEVATGETVPHGWFDLPGVSTVPVDTKVHNHVETTDPVHTSVEVPVGPTNSTRIMSLDQRHKRNTNILELFNKINSLAESDPETLDQPLDIFVERLGRLVEAKTNTGLASGLATAFSQFQQNTASSALIKHTTGSRRKKRKISKVESVVCKVPGVDVHAGSSEKSCTDKARGSAVQLPPKKRKKKQHKFSYNLKKAAEEQL